MNSKFFDFNTEDYDSLKISQLKRMADYWLRYDLNNVWLISEQSNTWDAQTQVEGYKSLHHKEFEEMLKKEIGEEKFNNLLSTKNNLRIFKRKNYIETIKKFRDE